MRVRALDIDKDWEFGKGANNYYRDQDAIRQNIDTRLNEFLGDCFFNLGAGVDWFHLLGAKDQALLNLSITSTILNTDGVTQLVQLSAALDTKRKFTVKYQVATVFSVISSIITVPVG